MGRYAEALADFDHTIALDAQDDRGLYRRAQLQLLIGQHDACHKDINSAITVARSNPAYAVKQSEDFYRQRFNVALYSLASGAKEDALAEYLQLLLSYSDVKRLQAAIDELEELLTVQPTNEHAQYGLHMLRSHIDEILTKHA